MSHAKLKAIDHSGLTLSILKSTVIKIAEWSGDIELSTSKYNFIHIQGHKPIKNKLYNHNTLNLKQIYEQTRFCKN
jgi:hypothetical protein